MANQGVEASGLDLVGIRVESPVSEESAAPSPSEQVKGTDEHPAAGGQTVSTKSASSGVECKGSPMSQPELSPMAQYASSEELSHTRKVQGLGKYMIVRTKHGDQHLKDVVLDPNNWRAGVTVALVSVPLSISLGIASGTTPMRGVATAVFGGLCSSLFGSSDYNIVGPAGALSGMFMSYCFRWSDDVLPWISLISAAMCSVCTALKLDQYMLLMPTSVFEGFTVAVAIIIGANQINFACGLTPEKKHQLFIMNIGQSLTQLDEIQWASFIVFILQTPLLFFLMKRFPNMPWTVIVPFASVPLGYLADSGNSMIGFDLLTLKTKYGVLAPELVQPLRPIGQIVPSSDLVSLLISSLSVAIVAILETLISAKIAASRVDRPFNVTRECGGITVAHAVCGLTGAMPPTGVFVRTALNTSLGSTHRFSQFLNAAIVAIIALAIMPVFSYLPQATIAALLVVAAIRMCPLSYLKKLWKESRGSFLLCLVTAAICVLEDPVIGLVVGFGLALLAGAKTSQNADTIDVPARHECNGHYSIQIVGALTYLNAEVFTAKVKALSRVATVNLSLANLRVLDHDGLCALVKVLQSWEGASDIGSKNVKVSNVGTQILPMLRKSSWFKVAESEGRVSLKTE